MKKVFISIFSLTVILAFVYKKPGDDNVFKQLYLLEGKWIMKTKKGSIGEEWVKMNSDYLQSKGFFINENDTVITERVALKKINGSIFYTSTVEDQNHKLPIAFRLTSWDKQIFIFENPEHDFPKRIVYHFISADSLHAYIDDGSASSVKRQDFYYRKVN